MYPFVELRGLAIPINGPVVEGDVPVRQRLQELDVSQPERDQPYLKRAEVTEIGLVALLLGGATGDHAHLDLPILV